MKLRKVMPAFIEADAALYILIIEAGTEAYTG
jgi:hypothetical protein